MADILSSAIDTTFDALGEMPLARKLEGALGGRAAVTDYVSGEVAELGPALARGFGAFGARIAGGEQGFIAHMNMLAQRDEKAADRDYQEKQMTRAEKFRLEIAEKEHGWKLDIQGRDQNARRTLQDELLRSQENRAEAALSAEMARLAATQKQQTGERIATQDWTSSERIDQNGFSTRERIDSQGYRTRERKEGQSWKTTERWDGQQWQSVERELDREATAEEKKKDRKLQRDLSQAELDLEQAKESGDAETAINNLIQKGSHSREWVEQKIEEVTGKPSGTYSRLSTQMLGKKYLLETKPGRAGMRHTTANVHNSYQYESKEKTRMDAEISKWLIDPLLHPNVPSTLGLDGITNPNDDVSYADAADIESRLLGETEVQVGNRDLPALLSRIKSIQVPRTGQNVSTGDLKRRYDEMETLRIELEDMTRNYPNLRYYRGTGQQVEYGEEEVARQLDALRGSIEDSTVRDGAGNSGVNDLLHPINTAENATGRPISMGHFERILLSGFSPEGVDRTLTNLLGFSKEELADLPQTEELTETLKFLGEHPDIKNGSDFRQQFWDSYELTKETWTPTSRTADHRERKGFGNAWGYITSAASHPDILSKQIEAVSSHRQQKQFEKTLVSGVRDVIAGLEDGMPVASGMKFSDVLGENVLTPEDYKNFQEEVIQRYMIPGKGKAGQPTVDPAAYSKLGEIYANASWRRLKNTAGGMAYADLMMQDIDDKLDDPTTTDPSLRNLYKRLRSTLRFNMENRGVDPNKMLPKKHPAVFESGEQGAIGAKRALQAMKPSGLHEKRVYANVPEMLDSFIAGIQGRNDELYTQLSLKDNGADADVERLYKRFGWDVLERFPEHKAGLGTGELGKRGQRPAQKGGLANVLGRMGSSSVGPLRNDVKKFARLLIQLDRFNAITEEDMKTLSPTQRAEYTAMRKFMEKNAGVLGRGKHWFEQGAKELTVGTTLLGAPTMQGADEHKSGIYLDDIGVVTNPPLKWRGWDEVLSGSQPLDITEDLANQPQTVLNSDAIIGGPFLSKEQVADLRSTHSRLTKQLEQADKFFEANKGQKVNLSSFQEGIWEGGRDVGPTNRLKGFLDELDLQFMRTRLTEHTKNLNRAVIALEHKSVIVEAFKYPTAVLLGGAVNEADMNPGQVDAWTPKHLADNMAAILKNVATKNNILSQAGLEGGSVGVEAKRATVKSILAQHDPKNISDAMEAARIGSIRGTGDIDAFIQFNRSLSDIIPMQSSSLQIGGSAVQKLQQDTRKDFWDTFQDSAYVLATDAEFYTTLKDEVIGPIQSRLPKNYDKLSNEMKAVVYLSALYTNDPRAGRVAASMSTEVPEMRQLPFAETKTWNVTDEDRRAAAAAEVKSNREAAQEKRIEESKAKSRKKIEESRRRRQAELEDEKGNK